MANKRQKIGDKLKHKTSGKVLKIIDLGSEVCCEDENGKTVYIENKDLDQYDQETPHSKTHPRIKIGFGGR